MQILNEVVREAVNRPLDYILLKLSPQCNLRCTYCYWFRDERVLSLPKTLLQEVESEFLVKLDAHIRKYGLSSFVLLFHGGEPLLVGKKRMEELCLQLKRIERETNCKMNLLMTTNGVLIDQEWTEIIKKYQISITISVDGPKQLHDSRRKTAGGRETYNSVMRSIKLLTHNGLKIGFLSVADPESDPREIYQFFSQELKTPHFDVLIPDENHDTLNPKSISLFYIGLFDTWYDDPNRGSIRLFENMIRGLLGKQSTGESIGFGPISTTTLLPNGDLEPLDVLRIAGGKETKASCNILQHDLDSIQKDPKWLSIVSQSVDLTEKCISCPWAHACGGAFMPTRYSSKNGYKNESVYCNDLQKIFAHIWSRIQKDLVLKTKVGSIRLSGKV